ncbi:MAG: DUF4390 domain-containing protein [Deltaproteobacteria bacterium]|nr:DUF4390 domain-containing protein [Deltaproteobacteria bacterium]
MKKHIALLIFFVFLAASDALAQAATITNFALSKAPLKVSFKVDGAFNRDIEEAIQSGLPTSFNFIIKLDKLNSFLPNEKVGSWEFRHTVKYDSFRNEYEITLDEAGGRMLKVNDSQEMKRLMATCEAVSIEPAHLVAGASYRMRVKAELDSIDLPPILNYVFFFLEAFDFETEWHIYEFPH